MRIHICYDSIKYFIVDMRVAFVCEILPFFYLISENVSTLTQVNCFDCFFYKVIQHLEGNYLSRKSSAEFRLDRSGSL